MPTRMEFNLSFGRSGGARPRPEGSALRLLLLGDFSARASRQAHDTAGLARRVPVRVDLDNFDAVLAALAPRIRPADGLPEVAVASMEDFHPDTLFERGELFQRLRGLRARLADAGSFAAAAEELRAQGLAPAVTPAAVAAAPAEADDGTIARLLGRPPTGAAPAPAPATPASAIDALIRSVVAPHIVPERAPFQAEYLAAVDAAIGEQMRRLLHDPAFAAVAARWLGVQWLVRGLPLGEELQLHLLDATREELQADLSAAGGDPGAGALGRMLRARGPDAPDGEPWGLLVALYDFGPQGEDVGLLAMLGALGAQLGGPVVADAKPALVGPASVAATPDPADWPALAGEDAQRWAALRRSALAPWIGLAAPRLLLRLPYGKRTDATERFAFEEQGAEPQHDTLAWAPAALGVAWALGEAFGENGWDMASGVAADLTDLPAYTFSRDGEKQLMPCAEAPLGERAGEAMLARGLIPLLSHRHRAAVRVFRVQSIAEPTQALAGSWG